MHVQVLVCRHTYVRAPCMLVGKFLRVQFHHTLPYPILSYPIQSYTILSYPILSNLILSYTILSYLILSYPILSYPILSNLILSYPILSYLILSYPILYYLILSYLILYYLILTFFTGRYSTCLIDLRRAVYALLLYLVSLVGPSTLLFLLLSLLTEPSTPSTWYGMI